MSFYFSFRTATAKRKEISSCVLKNNALNRAPCEDEEEDGVMTDPEFDDIYSSMIEQPINMHTIAVCAAATKLASLLGCKLTPEEARSVKTLKMVSSTVTSLCERLLNNSSAEH